MTASKDNLIWIDLEMTGLDSDKDVIIEIATIVTDAHLNIVAEGPVLAIHQSDAVMKSMDDWNIKTHGQSGLIERVRHSTVTTAAAEQQTLEFLRAYAVKGVSPMCGNSICQDRRFLYRLMPELETYFHYRNLDVSTLKMLCQMWAPAIAKGLNKASAHKALDDIKESIEELRYYRQHFIKLP